MPKSTLSKLFLATSLAATLVSCGPPESQYKREQREKREAQARADEAAQWAKERDTQAQRAAQAAAEIKPSVNTGPAPNILTAYAFGSAKVSELRSANTPNSTTLVVQGNGEAVASISFETAQKILGTPRLLSQFNLGGATVVEFQSASDTNVVCTYIERYAEPVVHDNQAFTFHEVDVYGGSLSFARKTTTLTK